MGLIEIIPNRGFFIRALTNDEALDLSKARAALFGSLAMMLAEHVTDETIAELRVLLVQMGHFADAGDVHNYYPINLEFHGKISVAAGNQRLAALYQSCVRELHIQRYRALSTGDTLHISNAEHRVIVEALEARDPIRSLVAARSHILNGIVRTGKTGEPLPKSSLRTPLARPAERICRQIIVGSFRACCRHFADRDDRHGSDDLDRSRVDEICS